MWETSPLKIGLNSFVSPGDFNFGQNVSGEHKNFFKFQEKYLEMFVLLVTNSIPPMLSPDKNQFSGLYNDEFGKLKGSYSLFQLLYSAFAIQ